MVTIHASQHHLINEQYKNSSGVLGVGSGPTEKNQMSATNVTGGLTIVN